MKAIGVVRIVDNKLEEDIVEESLDGGFCCRM